MMASVASRDLDIIQYHLLDRVVLRHFAYFRFVCIRVLFILLCEFYLELKHPVHCIEQVPSGFHSIVDLFRSRVVSVQLKNI